MKIVRIMWTWALEMFWVDREDGSRECVTSRSLLQEVGDHEFSRMNETAHRLSGHWHNLA